MPLIDPPGTGRRRRRRPSGGRPETAGNPNVAHAPAPSRRPHRPSGVFHESPVESPVTRVQRVQQHRVDRARRRLPPVPVATPPRLRNPTPTQTRAARKLIAQSITRAVGPSGTGAERLARRDALSREILTDPRYRETRRTIGHYVKAEADHAALAMAKLYGARGSRAKRLRAGRTLIAQRSPAFQAAPPPPHGVGGLATILADKLYGATSLGAASAENQFVKNAFGDVKTLGEAPFVGGYTIGKLGAEAVTGHPGRAGREALRIGKGILSSTVDEVKHPGRYLVQHPILFGLDVAGATAIAGRGAGAVARGLGSAESAGVRGALARAGSTVRSPLAIVNDAGAPSLVERDFSKDLTRKAGQVAADSLREPLRDASGKVVTVERGGRRVPVLLAHEGSTLRHPLKGEREALGHQKADVMASRANSVERMVRDEASKEMRVRGVRGRNAKDLVAMVVEGTITSAKHFRQDLESHARRLRAEIDSPGQYRDKAELEAAQNRLRLVERASTDPKVLGQAGKIVAAGEAIGRRLNEVEREAVAAGILHEKRAARSRLVPAAVEHLGGRFHDAPTVQEMARRAMTPEARQARIAELEGALRSQPAPKVGERIAAQQEIKALRALGDAPAVDVGRIGKSALKHGAIRHADGRFMANSEVEDFLRSRGRDPETVAFLPHREMGGRAFHAQFRPGSRPSLDTAARRTGEAYRRGSTESSTELIRSQGVRQRVQLAKAQQLDKMVREAGVRHPAVAKAERGEKLTKAEAKVVRQGGYFTAREAAELATRVEHDTASGVPVLVTKDGQRLVPLRAFAGKLDKETQRVIREELQGPGAMDSLSQRLLNDRVVRDFADTRTRNVVLAPASVVQRLEQHLRPAGEIEKFFQWLNRPFRLAVLPQPRWLTGNFVEPYIVRLTTTGSGVNVFGLAVDIRATNKVLKSLEKGSAAERQAAQEIRAHMLGGLFIGRRGASNRRLASEWLPHGAQVTYGRMVARLPVVGQMEQMAHDLGHLLVAPLDQFFRVNRHIESAAQRAGLGKHIRMEIQNFRSSWLDTVRLSERAIEEVKRGLVNTPTQARLVRKLHEDLGKYEGYGTKARAWIQGPMPFLPWALNAARFVYWTMPAHRTIQTALLVKVNNVVAKEWAAEHADVPPGGLKLAPRTARGGYVDIARYTPYGLTGPAAEGDLQGVTGEVAPQFQGAVGALEGKDPFGRDLQIQGAAYGQKPSFGQKLGIALNQLGESVVPYASTVRRLREGGGTAYSNSTVFSPKVKPGTSYMSAPRRVFDPFRPTYLHAPTGSSSALKPAGAAARHGAPTVDDRIDAALDRLQSMDAAQAAQDDRINQALDALGIP